MDKFLSAASAIYQSETWSAPIADAGRRRRPLSACCMREICMSAKSIATAASVLREERERWAVAPLGFSPWHLISPAPELAGYYILYTHSLGAQNLKERDTYPTEILTTVPLCEWIDDLYLGVWLVGPFDAAKFAYLRPPQSVCGDNKELFLIECVRE